MKLPPAVAARMVIRLLVRHSSRPSERVSKTHTRQLERDIIEPMPLIDGEKKYKPCNYS